MIYLALALLIVGALIGGVGMKRLGKVQWRTWRPGAALLAMMAFVAGAIFLVRGAVWEGLLLLALGAGLSVTAKKRAALPPAPASGMGRREAASILGVETDAAPAQIDEAYRRLIRRTHPDAGGSPGLAAQLNLARATLAQGPATRGRTTGRGAEPPRA